MTYIDEYTIQTIGSKWHKGKEKKNQVLAEMKSTDGTALKRLARFLEEYEEKNAQIGALKDEIQKMKDAAGPNKMGWMWLAPEYFSRWRIYPRAFITMYIYLLFQSANWFMALQDPTVAQSGLISVLVGAGAAWFGLYVNSTSTQHAVVEK